jgi:hypothetical protein
MHPGGIGSLATILPSSLGAASLPSSFEQKYIIQSFHFLKN